MTKKVSNKLPLKEIRELVNIWYGEGAINSKIELSTIQGDLIIDTAVRVYWNRRSKTHPKGVTWLIDFNRIPRQKGIQGLKV